MNIANLCSCFFSKLWVEEIPGAICSVPTESAVEVGCRWLLEVKMLAFNMDG